MLVNIQYLYTIFGAHKNVCMIFRKRLLDALLKVENKTLPPKYFIHIVTKYDGFSRMTRKQE